MKITSPAFAHQQSIPSKYTCDGANINPPLYISDVPKEAKSLVMLMEDPDVPKSIKEDGLWYHWLVYNVAPLITVLPENDTIPGQEGQNTSGNYAYDGPCPPDGEHRYFFKLYALDCMLKFDDPEKVTKEMITTGMKGHVIDKAELIGLYKRTSK